SIQETGLNIQALLKQRTGQSTVPNIFIQQHHIGGCSDLKEAYATGLLWEYLNNIFITDYDFDMMVIGGGSGGLAAAKEAAKFGKKVAICDFIVPTPKGTTWGLGGTCVNVGCIPKKLMHRAALIGETLNEAANFGWNLENSANHDWSSMVGSVQNYIKSLNWGYKKALRKQGITYFNSYASFDSNHKVMLRDGKTDGARTINSKNFILAMGCRPQYLDIPGAQEFCITSDDLFSLPHNPGRTLIVGASYIALECAGFLHGLGLKCSVMVRSILLRGFDRSIASKIGEHMEEIGIDFIRECVPTEIKLLKEGTPPLLLVKGIFANKTIYEGEFNTVILAIGREARIFNMGLQKVSVDVNPVNGKIITNEYDQTTNRTIFAIGDIVVGMPELTPVAIKAGILLAQRLYGKKTAILDRLCIPTTVFTPLEYGCVGLSEELAAEKYETISVFHRLFQPLENTLSGLNKNKCYAKLVCHVQEEVHRVVGLHVLSPNAGEICQGFALAVKLGATKDDFDMLIGIHPTCAEVKLFLSIFFIFLKIFIDNILTVC
ncbi:hypothetical protein AAG570_013171, partial [Ranatra chinensis]